MMKSEVETVNSRPTWITDKSMLDSNIVWMM